MKIERLAAAAIAAGVLGVSAILLVGPRNAESAEKASAPVLQSVTSSGYPYSSLAILRAQPTATDVLPASIGDSAEKYLPATVRHLVVEQDADGWLALNAAGDLCLVATTPGEAGTSSICSTAPPVAPAAGTTMASFGAGDHLNIQIISDGTPAPGEVEKGYHQIAPNVWFRGRGEAVPRTFASSDPFAFPRAAPYRSYEILRRNRAAADEAPASFRQAGGLYDDLRLDQLRFAGEFHGAKIWVTVDTGGHACIVAQNEVGIVSCATTSHPGAGERVAGAGAQDVDVELIADGRPAADEIAGKTRVAPNVWASLLSD